MGNTFCVAERKPSSGLRLEDESPDPSGPADGAVVRMLVGAARTPVGPVVRVHRTPSGAVCLGLHGCAGDPA